MLIVCYFILSLLVCDVAYFLIVKCLMVYLFDDYEYGMLELINRSVFLARNVALMRLE